jgi:hypothetical protein
MKRIYTQASRIIVWLGGKKCHKEVVRLFDAAAAHVDSKSWIKSKDPA